MNINAVSFEDFINMLGIDTEDLKAKKVEINKGTEIEKLVEEMVKNIMSVVVSNEIDKEFAEFKKAREKSFELGGDLYHKTIAEYLNRGLTAEETALVDFAFMLAYTNGWYDHEKGENNDK